MASTYIHKIVYSIVGDKFIIIGYQILKIGVLADNFGGDIVYQFGI